MTTLPVPAAPAGPLRQRLIDEMDLRRFSRETQRNYIRDIGRLAPNPASADDLCRFQVALQEDGCGLQTMNAVLSALHRPARPVEHRHPELPKGRLDPAEASQEELLFLSCNDNIDTCYTTYSNKRAIHVVPTRNRLPQQQLRPIQRRVAQAGPSHRFSLSSLQQC